MDGLLASAFETASGFLVDAVKSVPSAAWDASGLGTWKVRELVAHANRAHTTVEEYLLHPQPPEPPGSSYFSDAAVAARGRMAAAALGGDPAAAVAHASERVVALVRRADANATIGSPAGTMTLADYLPSRVAELTVHALDIVKALELDLTAPAVAVQESIRFLCRQAERRGKAQDVLLALSGRAQLPPGFWVY